MASHFVIIALFIGICACLRTSQLAAQNECSDLRVYFAVADARMGEQFIALIEDDEWMARMDAAITKANHSEMSILVLSPDEMDAFATFLSVPGDVLLSMEVNDEVPKIANELHNSALELWLLFPPMMRSVASGGIFGAFPFAEEIESLEAENLEAQITLRQRCPAEIAAAESFAEEAAQRNGALDILEPETMTDLSPAAFKGTAFEMLFFSESGDSGTLPLPDPTPNNQTDDIAVAQTEVADSRATLWAQETLVATIISTDTPRKVTSTAMATEESDAHSPEAVVSGTLAEEELFALLPDASIMPQRLDQVTDSTRTEAEVATALGGSRDAETRLQNWGWTANVERDFQAPEGSGLPATATTYISIGLHGFTSEQAAAEALTYYSDIVVGLGYEEAEAGDIGATNRLLIMQEEDGGTVVALYVQKGSVLYRIGGYSPAGDPTADVLDIAQQMIEP